MGEAKTKKQQFRKTYPTCVFCGVRDGTTKDHVPPKGMFPKPRPQLITVPACPECNGGAATIDERFRTMLSLRVGAGTAETMLFWQALTLPGLQKNQRFRRELVDGMRHVVLPAPDGTVVREVPVFQWDAESHDSTITRMTRGLYFHEFRSVLPIDVPIRPYFFRGLDADMRTTFAQGRIVRIGDAFEYSVLPVSEDPHATFWLFNFYGGRHVAGAATGVLALDDDDSLVPAERPVTA